MLDGDLPPTVGACGFQEKPILSGHATPTPTPPSLPPSLALSYPIPALPSFVGGDGSQHVESPLAPLPPLTSCMQPGHRPAAPAQTEQPRARPPLQVLLTLLLFHRRLHTLDIAENPVMSDHAVTLLNRLLCRNTALTRVRFTKTVPMRFHAELKLQLQTNFHSTVVGPEDYAQLKKAFEVRP